LDEEGDKNPYKTLVSDPEGKRSPGRAGRRLDKDIEHDDVDWVQLAQDKIQGQVLVNTVIDLLIGRTSSCIYTKNVYLFPISPLGDWRCSSTHS
jgi:hypothetical protein